MAAAKRYSGQEIDRQKTDLIELGYLQKQEFQFTNRFLIETNRLYFLYCITNSFNRPIPWDCGFVATNEIEVSAPPEDMPKWKKLVADFDR
jgi:hypothetical protein